MFPRGKKAHKGALTPVQGFSSFRCIEGFCLQETCFLSQEKQERSGKAQWYLISEKSLLDSQALPVREAQPTAQLGACRGHHINKSWFSYRQSFRLAWLCPTVNTQTASGTNSPAARDFVGCCVGVIPWMFCLTYSWLGWVSGLVEDSDNPQCCGSLVPVEGFLVTFVRMGACKCPFIRFSSFWMLGLESVAWLSFIVRSFYQKPMRSADFRMKI